MFELHWTLDEQTHADFSLPGVKKSVIESRGARQYLLTEVIRENDFLDAEQHFHERLGDTKCTRKKIEILIEAEKNAHECTEDCYIEIHFKLKGVSWDEVAGLPTPDFAPEHLGVVKYGFSYSLTSATKHPLLTYRVYSPMRLSHAVYERSCREHLQKFIPFASTDPQKTQIHIEHVCYDDNETMDDDWLGYC